MTTDSGTDTSASPSPAPPERLASIDAYRGLVMFLMMAEVLRLCQVAGRLPGNRFWELLCHHQSHVEWVGCSLHDLIQPSFSFLVGVALPSRWRAGWRGAVESQNHGARALAVADPGIPGGFPPVARSVADQFHVRGHPQPDRPGLHVPVRAGSLLAASSMDRAGADLDRILGGLRPLSGSRPASFDFTAVGVPADWPHHPAGFAAHWDKNSNLAWAFDTWFLNLFPREKPFIA